MNNYCSNLKQKLLGESLKHDSNKSIMKLNGIIQNLEYQNHSIIDKVMEAYEKLLEESEERKKQIVGKIDSIEQRKLKIVHNVL